MEYKFDVVFLETAREFLDQLEPKARDKIYYNIWKSRLLNDKELFKKLSNEIWEFRTLHKQTYYRIFAFWDKSSDKETLVVATHGIIKKTDKTPSTDIERADYLRTKYLKEK